MNMITRLAVAGCLLAAGLPALAAGEHSYAFGHPASANAATRTVDVTLGDMYFEPKALEVKAGETVRFVLHNKGQVQHEFSLGDAAMHARHQKEMLEHAAMGHSMAGMQHDDLNTVMVAPGQSAELTWAFSKATGLEFACNVPGHYQAGMVGQLTVDQ
jgi:uncharacterized cupredoxin-like copper-binding protein